MGRNCNLDLSLFSPGAGSSLESTDSSKSKIEESSSGDSHRLKFVYGGQVCICDVAEIQARAILCLAKREMEENLKGGCWGPSDQLHLHGPTLSLKRSLQRFLQKRRSRIQRTSPY